MFDHLGMVVASLPRSRGFYEACLEPLGIRLLEVNEGWLVFGRGGDDPFFVVSSGATTSFWTDRHVPAQSPIHVAFVAPDRGAVDGFHASGLANGGSDNGAPGERRAAYLYYAAFLLDPDGNNVEAGYRG